MKILCGGPFLGDFEQEIITFRPYIRYISEIDDYDKIYISSHFNRSFLYHWNDEFYPIYENLSRNELKQKGYIHIDISIKDYNLLLKEYKQHIIEKEKCYKKDIDLYNISYIKSISHYSIYQKIFEPIQVPNIDLDKEFDIILIPYNTIPEEQYIPLIHQLKKCYNITVVGDLKCCLYNQNIIFNYPDWPENGYKYILKCIDKAKMVITPCSFWTFICNLQNKPVFSWGDYHISLYKKKGIYNFNNNNMIIYYDNKELEKLKDSVDYFYNLL